MPPSPPASGTTTAALPAKRYQLQPPLQRQLHRQVEHGFADFYPVRITDREDTLTPDFVKQGFRPLVVLEPENESAWDTVGAEFRDPATGRVLRERVNEFLLKAVHGHDEAFKLAPARPFARPVRAAVPIERKDAWMTQLVANEPLSTRVRSVPHGPRVRRRPRGLRLRK